MCAHAQCICVCVFVCTHVRECLCKSENNSMKPGLSFHLRVQGADLDPQACSAKALTCWAILSTPYFHVFSFSSNSSFIHCIPTSVSPTSSPPRCPISLPLRHTPSCFPSEKSSISYLNPSFLPHILSKSEQSRLMDRWVCEHSHTKVQIWAF